MRYIPILTPTGCGFRRECEDTIYLSTIEIGEASIGDEFIIIDLTFTPTLPIPKNGEHVIITLDSIKQYKNGIMRYIIYGLDDFQSDFCRKNPL